jgi:hypothetical protein
MARQAAGCSSGIGGEAAGLAATLLPLGAAAAVAATAFELLGTGACFPPGESGNKLGRERCSLLSGGCSSLAAARAGGTCPAASVPAPPLLTPLPLLLPVAMLWPLCTEGPEL